MRQISIAKITAKSIVFMTVLLIQVFAGASDLLSPSTCLLNFERKTHLLSKKLTKKFSNLDAVRIINGALPIDILKCLDEGASNLIIIAHAADLGTKNQVIAPFLYEKELQGQARKDYIEKIQKLLDSEVAKLQAEIQHNQREETENSYYNKVFDYARQVKNIPANQLIYDNPPRIVENQIFKRILNNPQFLRKISFVSCLPEKVLAYYPEINELQRRGIEIKFAPKNRVMSFFMGQNVTSPNYDWIRNEIFSRP